MKTLKTARRVASVRSERGYSATKYDGSAGKVPETIRRHCGRFYDVKKVRNTYDQTHIIKTAVFHFLINLSKLPSRS